MRPVVELLERRLEPASASKASKAGDALPLVLLTLGRWTCAVLSYHHAGTALEPLQAELAKRQRELHRANARLEAAVVMLKQSRELGPPAFFQARRPGKGLQGGSPPPPGRPCA